MSQKRQCCNKCKGPIRAGALHPWCARELERRQAPQRAERLLQAVATVHMAPTASSAARRDLALLAEAAAKQLAEAWGAKKRNGRSHT